jgi:hypothetical protein
VSVFMLYQRQYDTDPARGQLVAVCTDWQTVRVYVESTEWGVPEGKPGPFVDEWAARAGSGGHLLKFIRRIETIVSQSVHIEHPDQAADHAMSEAP